MSSIQYTVQYAMINILNLLFHDEQSVFPLDLYTMKAVTNHLSMGRTFKDKFISFLNLRYCPYRPSLFGLVTKAHRFLSVILCILN